MELRFVHLYPDLMNLYGSWGNVAVLKRHLEDLGNQVAVEEVHPGETPDWTDVDFIFMGAGTERSQMAALGDCYRLGKALRAAAEDETPMLFCGAAMQMLGQFITDPDGKMVKGLDMTGFTSVQGRRRFVGDVYGYTALFQAPVVGFMNSCTKISNVDAPLLTHLALGFGNDQEGGPEGYHKNNLFASELTGPLLVKNPLLLRAVMSAIYDYCGEVLPESLPSYPHEARSYEITERELGLRCQKKES